MLNVALKSLWAHKFRLVATSLAVIIGVSLLAGTLVLTGTMNKNFNDLFANAYKNTDAVVRSPVAFGSDSQGNADAQRPPIEASLLTTVKSVEGVKSASGLISGFAQIVKKDGSPLSSGGAPTFGENWVADSASPFQIVEGSAPKTDNEVVIDKGSANTGKFHVGDSVTVLLTGPPMKFTISGIAKFGSADNPAGATEVFFTENAAQQYVGQPGKFDSIGVSAKSGVSQTELQQRLTSALPKSVEVLTGKAITKESQNQLKSALKFFNIFLLVFAGITLFVGVFIIYNTFSILVAQRTRDNALLRAIGASRRQITTAVLIEAFFVGLIAAAIGLGAGIGLAVGLKALLAAIGLKLPASGVIIPSSAIISSFIVGIVVSMASAWFPARRAAKTPPVAAMRDIQIDKAGSSLKRLVAGLVVLILGVGLIMLGLFGSLSRPYVPVGLGAVITFLGVAALGPTFASPAALILGAFPARFRGISGKLAMQNARRNPRRTSSTAAALMIGVGLVGFMFIITTSFKASVTDVLNRTFSGDFVIQPSGQQSTGLPTQLRQQLSALPEVRAAAGIATGIAEVNGNSNALNGVSITDLLGVVDPQVTSGSFKDLNDSSIAVSKKVADSNKWSIGTVLPVKFTDAPQKNFTVRAIYKNDQLLNSYVISDQAFAESFSKVDYEVILVGKAKGVSLDSARAAIDNVANAYPNAKVEDQAQFKNDLAGQIDKILGIFVGLLALAVVIALIGIANTLVLSIYERTRELGLLRAVGMTRRQVRSAIRWEAVIVALFGTILGLIVAVFFGVSLVSSLKDQGVTALRVPVPSLLLITVIGGLAGVLAAIWPAWRASRLNVLRSISSE